MPVEFPNDLNERTMNTNERQNQLSDQKRTALYVVNGCVCDWADYFGKYPTVDDVRSSWKLKMNDINGQVTDEEIEEVIRMVERQDMGLWN